MNNTMHEVTANIDALSKNFTNFLTTYDPNFHCGYQPPPQDDD
jgi:hypothetical protein